VAVVQPSEERGRGGTLQEKLTAISILLQHRRGADRCQVRAASRGG
jgi:hypothetical protein